jgi:hypothetical protein
MKISYSNTEQIRERMGADAEPEQAERMIAILLDYGFADTDDVTDEKWFDLVAEACA